MAGISEDEQIDLLFKKFTNTVNANPALPFSNTQNRRFPFQNFEFSKNLFIDDIPENLDNITYNGLLGSAALDASFGVATDISYEIPNYPLLYYHRIELTNALDGLNNTSWYYPDPNNDKLSLLRGSIPFNYDPINFTYKQLLYSNSDQEEALNSNPLYWLFDYKSGFVQFYGDPDAVTNWVNTNGPPRISVIVYNGNKGLENFSGGSGITISGNLNDTSIILGILEQYFPISLDVNGNTLIQQIDNFNVTGNLNVDNNAIINDLLVDQRWGINTTTLSHKSLTELTNFGLYFNSGGYTVLNSSNSVNCDIKVDNNTKLSVGSGVNTSYNTLSMNSNNIISCSGINNNVKSGVAYNNNDSINIGYNGENAQDITIRGRSLYLEGQASGVSLSSWRNTFITASRISNNYGTIYLRVNDSGNRDITYNGYNLDMQGKSIINNSDDRLKHNEIIINNGLEIIRQLVPQKYQKTQELLDENYNGDLNNYEWIYESGVIAQDILNITDLSYIVYGGDYIDESGNYIKKPYSLKYNDIFIYNIAATKELDNIVQQQKNEIDSLKQKNLELENKLNEILIELGKTTV